MSSVVPVKIIYAKGIRLSMKKKTFREAMEFIWKSPAFSDYEPLKMVFTSTGKVLFMDKNAFHSYLSGNISQQELIELTECDELYRNKVDIEHNGYEIEAGHLWKASLNVLTLIDDDNHVETKLDVTKFEIVEPYNE